MATEQEITDASKGKLVVQINMREMMESLMKAFDAFDLREGENIPLSSQEVASMIHLANFFRKTVRNAPRRCLCDSVYCKIPMAEKETRTCMLTPDEIHADPNVVMNCEWRGMDL